MGLPGKFKRLRVQNKSNDVYINDINTLVVPDDWLVITGPDEATLIGGDVFDAGDYGIVGVAHGGTPSDESTALLALLAIVYAAGGGVIRFRNRKYRFDSSILLPNDGDTPVPAQPSMKFVGQGASHNGRGGAPNGGTIIDLRFTGTPAKIDTRGTGLFEIASMTLIDGGGASSTPFVQTTNTTLKIDQDVEFYGNTANTPTQDAIVLGGTALTGDGSANSPFQGYGTIIKNCYFNNIQRGVYGRTYCNAVVVRDNIWWTHCGATSAAAAIEFLGDATNSNSGNVIDGNLVEMGNYVYGVKLTYCTNNNLGPNGFFDAIGGTTLAYYRFEASSVYNFVVDGYRDDATGTLISETGASVGTNTVLTGHQAQPSIFTPPVIFRDAVKQLRTNSAAWTVEDTSGHQVYQVFANPNWHFYYLPSGGSQEVIASLERISSTRKDFVMQGSADNRITAASELRLQAASGGTLWLGTTAVQDAILVTGTLTTIANLRATALTAGSAPTTLTDAAGKILSAALNTVGATVGGTGLATVAQGDLLYGSASNTWSALAKNTTATRYLSNTGTSNNPAWAQVDLTNGITGTLPIANGGTGDTGTAWGAWTPTVTAVTGTFTTVSAAGRYKTIGKTVFFNVRVTITTNGTAAGAVKITLPATAANITAYQVVSGRETTTTSFMLTGAIQANTTTMYITKYDGTYLGANGYTLDLSGVYEST